MSEARKWAELRFGVVGQMLASPPHGRGEVGAAIAALAQREWTHPTSGEPVRFAPSTIERWYYAARREAKDRLGRLARRRRRDAGKSRVLTPPVVAALEAQYREHPSWTVQLHHDNLVAAAETAPELGTIPSYQSLRRYLRGRGLDRVKRRRRHRREREGEKAARDAIETREVRSYEASHVGSLWHTDLHFGRLKVVTRKGAIVTPIALAVIDDRSRLCCHAQWYFTENTRDFVHGLSQAIMKRGLPAALMTDNGAAMLSDEFRQGLARLAVLHRPTMAYSPHQNAKIEAFWGTLEGRLVAMLERVEKLTIDELNRATIAWVEQEYNARVHSETGARPVDRFLGGPSVLRPSPSPDELRRAFRLEEKRIQRRSDGTIPILGVRFELPEAIRHVREVTVHYARWDLATVDVVDPISGAIVCPIFPLDREKNADGRRRVVAPRDGSGTIARAAGTMAPLLTKIIAEHEATGLGAAFLPTPEDDEKE